MARPVPPRDEQWMLYLYFVITVCLLMSAHLQRLVMNVLSCEYPPRERCHEAPDCVHGMWNKRQAGCVPSMRTFSNM
ncbi:hypothetical protein DPMN_050265 [Dreissena polymorpha]|uniref:Uncharacterized protein n=1 Tax=Dreissena polymorpha TaxID=45954 RepID=A0A9D4CH58_DREPO|nr:hypothetical protein DPMN_050265 [Dreissena polymorpha]